MKLESILIGMVFLAICLTPFVFFYMNTQKNSKQTLQLLTKYANENNSNITLKEFCGDFAIGLDETLNKLFFVKKNTEDNQSVCIDLNSIESCVTNTVRKSAKNTSSAITSLELEFISQGKNQKENALHLFDDRINSQLTGEILFAEKWSKTINSKLKSTNASLV